MNTKVIDVNGFIKKYAGLYFKPISEDEKEKRIGHVRLLGTSRDVENSLFPDDRIEKIDLIKDIHIAWKAGRLTQQMLEAEEKVPPLNGRGKTITNLDQFLDDVNKNRIIDESIQDYDERARFAIEKLYELKDKNNVGQMGSVYLIAILFFLSGGEYPVYDKYAHTAVKALFFDRNPKDVFVGEAPQGENALDKIAGMYSEYCYLLKEIFGTSGISRELDRALWVYGHSVIKF